jgi:hypothetical protein
LRKSETESSENPTVHCTQGGAKSAVNLELGEAIGGQEGGHFEYAVIVVALGELRGGGIVDDEGDVGMKLQGGGGDGGGDGSFDGFGDGSGLGGAGGEQENFPGFQNRADAHGDGTARTLFAGSEGFCIVVQRLPAQDFEARAGTNAGSGLVEADVTVAADAQDLEVDAAGLADGLFIGGAVLIVIAADGAVGNVDIARIYIDAREEIFVHEMMEALRMCGGKTEIFIEIKSNDAGEIERALLVERDELFVDADHGAASGQAKRQSRFFAYRAGNELSGLKANFFGVAFQDHQHAASSLNRPFSIAVNNYEPAKNYVSLSGNGE